MSNSSGGDPLEGCYDTELLEALLGEAPKDSGGVGGEERVSLAGGVPSPPASVFSRLFMIGGSLFARQRQRSSRGVRQGLRGGGRRLRGTQLAWLDYAAIYCPFTRQFISLRSPHWSHLRSAGFAIDGNLHQGRRVTLLRPWQLHTLASELQRDVGAKGTLETKDEEEKGKNILKNWSPTLRQSLGILLESTPVNNKEELKKRVMDVLHDETDIRTGRRIPLCFYNFAEDKRENLLSSTSTEVTYTNISPIIDEKRELDKDEAYLNEIMIFGEKFLNQCLMWRLSVLQRRKKIINPIDNIFVSAKESINIITPLLTSNIKSDNLIKKFSSLNSNFPLIPNTQLAYLSVSFNPEISLIDIVVNTILRKQDSSKLLFCPIEHCVDYNSLTDLEAYKINFNINGVMEFRESIPILNLGMHTDDEKIISSNILVVISNAHLLSQRAIARLLDQWTRNGAVQTAKNNQIKGIKENKWDVLIRASEPMRAVGDGMPLFGNISALFIGYKPFQYHQKESEYHKQENEKEKEKEIYTDFDNSKIVAQIQSDNINVNIHSPKSGSIFFIEEPIAAALRRASSIFQNSMSFSEQRVFIEELCDASSCIKFLKDEEVKKNEKNSIDNRENNEHIEEDILLQFQEAYEMFLTHPIENKDVGLLAYEELFQRYPKFALIRIRHDLIREYPLSIKFMKNDNKNILELLKNSSNTKNNNFNFQFPVKRSITLVENRYLARKRSEEDHETLKREYVTKMTLQRVKHSSINSIINSSKLPILKNKNNTYTNNNKTHYNLIEQCYEPLFEPPVLLGSWTKTLLFCAPVIADVIPLRHLLHLELNKINENKNIFQVIDVDIFHIDYVSYPSDRRCRLFGVRLRLKSFTNNIYLTREIATISLQHVLAKSAVGAQLFPLWTHNLFSKNIQKNKDKTSIISNTYLNDRDNFSTRFNFEEIDECLWAAQPNIVEKRLFALAIAQYGPLRLTIGSQLIALQRLSLHIPRGTWCKVVRFIPLDNILTNNKSLLLSSDNKEGLRYFTEHDILLTQRYFENQNGKYVLPVIKPMTYHNENRLKEKEEEEEKKETIVLPVAMLIGGYRSLHYYALPIVQFPLLSPCQYAAISTLFHPFFTHEDNLMEFVSSENIFKAISMMLSPYESSNALQGNLESYTFWEDIVSEGRNEVTKEENKESNNNNNNNNNNNQKSLNLQCDVLSAISLFPQKIK